MHKNKQKRKIKWEQGRMGKKQARDIKNKSVQKIARKPTTAAKN